MNLIHSTGRGYPRAVNNLALQSLVAAFAAGKNLVDEAAARSAITEVVDYPLHLAHDQRHLANQTPPPGKSGGAIPSSIIGTLSARLIGISNAAQQTGEPARPPGAGRQAPRSPDAHLLA